MSKYRRIEINAYHRRVTVVSGEWGRGDIFHASPAQTDERVSLDAGDSCEPVELDSPEGQLILVEAIRSLERRISPEARALICAGQDAVVSNHPNRNRFFRQLQSFHQSIRQQASRFARKE